MSVRAANNPWRFTAAIKLYFVTPWWLSEVIIQQTAEATVLIHDPADDINIGVIWWVGTQEVFCSLDELVLYKECTTLFRKAGRAWVSKHEDKAKKLTVGTQNLFFQ